MIEPITIQDLRHRLDLINQRWNADHYRSLMDFFVRILPRVMDCERCSIFRIDPASGAIESFVGTGLDRDTVLRPPADAIVSQTITTGAPITDNDIHRRPGYHREAAKITGFVTRNIQCVPLRSPINGHITGAVQVLNRNQGGFDEDDRLLLEDVADFLSMAVENLLLNEEILSLSASLHDEIAELRGVSERGMVADSDAMQNVLDQVQAVANTPVNVLLTGEKGSGAEQIAHLIHSLSSGLDQPFVKLNCASLSENLLETELFGFEQDAFSEASIARPGRLEQAKNGTLFLEEIGALPRSLQERLLRVLETGEGERVGDDRLRKYEVRFVSSSTQDLRELVAAGGFIEALYYNLFSVDIALPPLRERKEDIAILANHFLQEISKRFGKAIGPLPPRILASFEQYDWPGNVRQLRSEAERLVALTPDGLEPRSRHCSEPLREIALALPADQYPEAEIPAIISTREISSAENLPDQVAALERQLIIEAMTQTQGNKTAAADMLCITRQGLHNKLRRYGLSEHRTGSWRSWPE